MTRLLRDGTVDIYFDSPFPTLAVQRASGSEVVLRRWKQGEPTYWSTYIASLDNGIVSVDDLVGKVVAFEEPHSTSGFVLPAGTLIERGFTLTEVGGYDSVVAPDEIGYFFSLDEENTIEMVARGLVVGGAVSNLDYEELPEEIKQQIVAFGETISVPRQLVSVREGLERRIVDRVTGLLVELDRTEEGRELLEGLKSTKKFDPLPDESQLALRRLQELIELVEEN